MAIQRPHSADEPEEAGAALTSTGARTPGGALTPTALTPTGRVILGMIALGRTTGYDIKQLVDKSTRHFWAASYGQIYPELQRLEEQGLVRGRPEPSGGRARTVYELTDAGERALVEWLRSDEQLAYELRDEGMLKLFFSDIAPEATIENVRAMRAMYERKHAQLAALREKAGDMRRGPALTLEIGLGVSEWLIQWCLATERLLAAHADPAPGPPTATDDDG
jgi:DNA-binding PadR family transcriptional regulator